MPQSSNLPWVYGALNLTFITMHFSINFPTVICSPIVCYVLEREASSENYALRVYSTILLKLEISCCNLFNFILFCNLFIYLSLSELILASNEFKGLTTLLPALGESICFYMCRCCLGEFAWFSFWFHNLGCHWGKYLSPYRGKFQCSLQVTDSKMHIPTQLTSSWQ